MAKWDIESEVLADLDHEEEVKSLARQAKIERVKERTKLTVDIIEAENIKGVVAAAMFPVIFKALNID